MRFYYIRHAQSANNALYDASGASKGRTEDPEITEIGQQQTIFLADFIRRLDYEYHLSGSNHHKPRRDFFGITHLYTSLMIRSVQTGTALSEAMEIPLVAWPDIHETGGIFLDDEETNQPVGLPGKPRSYFTKNFKDLVLPDTITEEGWWNRPFETREQRPIRARNVYKELLERHGGTDDCVAFVSHGAFYMHLMREVFNIQGENIWYMMNNTGISRIDFEDDGSPILIYHNRTDHLPDQLLT